MSSELSNKSQGYTVVPQNVTHDKELSLKALGLLVLLMSLPDGWEFSVNGITAISKDGRDSVRSGVIELEELGYLRRQQKVDGTGRFDGYVWHVSSVPCFFKEVEANPSTENPSTENATQVNKQQVINQQVSTPITPLASEIVREAVGYLNEVTGSSFKDSNQSTRRKVSARISDGFTIDDMRLVIDHKFSQWGSDEKMRQYLRPETLFGTKFEGYLQEARRCANGDAAYQSFDSVW